MPRTASPAEVVMSDDTEATAFVPQHVPSPQVLQPATRNAKVKGTWLFHYGPDKYDFVDGQRYDLPLEVFEYLKRSGNIYDTL